MEKKIYFSKIDWWVWCVVVFALVVVWAASIGTYWWLTLIFGASMIIMLAVPMLGCWYEIDGDQLVVRQFFVPHKFPIKKIKVVKYTIGYLATAGMSRHRVSIKFTDRSVLKSSMPLEISPNNRDGFVADLLKVNPDIEVVR